MNAYTSNTSLIIHPDESNWLPESPEKIAALLRDTGLIADRLQTEEQCYLVGNKFLELVTFLGCSPNIKLTPEHELDKYCFVRLITNDRITVLTGKHTHPPRCPHCKKPEKNWPDRITATALKCSSCGQSSSPWLYNWRKSAGFGRFFIELTEIYPNEAIPQPALLDALRQQSATSWNYFYLHS